MKVIKDLLKRLTNKRILIASSMVAIAIAITIGATGAFFSDDETSRDNIFSAGAIDLQIDNESYYNGEFQENLSWELRDLTIEKFFDFPDLKPGDEGEDTISIHVGSNDAWVCMDVDLTATDENEITEPESEDGDVTEDEGELQNFINFVWWPDDGDNVLEDDEAELAVFTGTLGEMDGLSIPLADASGNAVFGDEPLPGDSVNYIAKAWCYGELQLAPLTQDIGDNGRSPSDPEGAGVLCDGEDVDNTSQTDSVVGDIVFTAIQSRNNLEFICGEGELPPPPPVATSTLTVIKEVINDDGGTGTTTDFSFTVDGGADIAFLEGGNVLEVSSGTSTVAEVAAIGYTSTISGDCDENGEVNIAPGGSATCTITNDDIPAEEALASITVTKVVVNDNGGTAVEGDFSLDVSGTSVTTGVAADFVAGAYVVGETGPDGYTATISGECAADGSITMDPGVSYNCTITNDDQPATLTVTKVVDNSAAGDAEVGDFELDVNGEPVVSGVSEEFAAGSYLVSEGPIEVTEPYDASFSGDCDASGNITMEIGGTYSCTITNVGQPT